MLFVLILVEKMLKASNGSQNNCYPTMKVEIIKKIVGYGDRYTEIYLTDVFDKELMIKDWWSGLQFFLSRSFYQGRSDIVSSQVEQEAMDSIKEFIKRNNGDPTSLINSNNFPSIENAISQVIGKGKIGRGRDIKMVISILQFVSKLDEKNIIKYSISKIKSGNVENHFEELDDIFSIGPKIAAFYLRDLVLMYSLDSFINRKDLVYLQPIDTWVRKVAHKVGIINNIDEEEIIIREKIVKACLDLNIPSIKFNQGAWFLGYNSFDIILKKLDKI